RPSRIRFPSVVVGRELRVALGCLAAGPAIESSHRPSLQPALRPSLQITAEDFYQLSDFIRDLDDGYGDHPARGLAQICVQSLARVVQAFKRVFQGGGLGVERVVLARAAEFRTNLAGGFFDLSQLLLAGARETAVRGFLRQVIRVDLDLGALV